MDEEHPWTPQMKRLVTILMLIWLSQRAVSRQLSRVAVL
jgi:hypothetical protein